MTHSKCELHKADQDDKKSKFLSQEPKMALDSLCQRILSNIVTVPFVKRPFQVSGVVRLQSQVTRQAAANLGHLGRKIDIINPYVLMSCSAWGFVVLKKHLLIFHIFYNVQFIITIDRTTATPRTTQCAVASLCRFPWWLVRQKTLAKDNSSPVGLWHQTTTTMKKKMVHNLKVIVHIS